MSEDLNSTASAGLEISDDLYIELHSIATQWMRKERNDGILQTTMIVHEAFLRLNKDQSKSWKSREEFCAAASVTMRRLLVDHARQRAAAKRGGNNEVLNLSDSRIAVDEASFQAIDLHESLEKLASFAQDQARVLELMYFGGMSGDAIAEIMQVSSATVDRRLRAAKAWLRKEMSSDSSPTDS